MMQRFKVRKRQIQVAEAEAEIFCQHQVSNPGPELPYYATTTDRFFEPI